MDSESQPRPQSFAAVSEPQTPSREAGSVIRHVALLSVLLAPIAFIPYVITRRQLGKLRRQVEEIGATTAALRQTAVEKPLPSAMPKHDVAGLRLQIERNAAERAKALSAVHHQLDDLREEMVSLRNMERVSQEEVGQIVDSRLQEAAVKTDEALRFIIGQQESLQSHLFKLESEIQTLQSGPQAVNSAELHRLLEDARLARGHFTSIGSSLGDIATIIQRIEIELGHERALGYDPVERLRVLALRMQEEQM
ncbi:Growth arrest-specific 2-like [Mycena chlorophos]|uniref:Growth arrest-specific 2-like n=1 Tax=Mycena chlorophos TaxID=658473 RepID=A0A8H6T9V2_MYCCL|nr:Growth arrest-specific 2-like [Mycena chlorophos]